MPRNRAKTVRAIVLALCAAGLAGCAQDPYQRPDTWSLPPDSQSSNDRNLRTMIVDPRDLVAGEADTSGGIPASEAAPAVHRLLTGHRPALPSADASSVDSGSQQQQSTPAAGPNVGQ